MTGRFQTTIRFFSHPRAFLAGGMAVLLAVSAGCSKKNDSAANVHADKPAAAIRKEPGPVTSEKPKSIMKQEEDETLNPPGFLCEKDSPDEKTCRRITPNLFE